MPVLVAREGSERCVARHVRDRLPAALHHDRSRGNRPRDDAGPGSDIDLSRCMFCGLCEEACPEEAIVMSPDVEIACESREGLVWHKDQLLKPAHLLKPRLEYIRREYNRYESARGAATDVIGACNARLGSPDAKRRPTPPPVS
jgi:NADH-quinone oxidoreductase subunit I